MKSASKTLGPSLRNKRCSHYSLLPKSQGEAKADQFIYPDDDDDKFYGDNDKEYDPNKPDYVKEVIDDTEKDEIFQYLFELQSSGKTNMFGSIPWVQGEFPHLDVKEVKAVVMEWMQNYQEIHDRMGIDFI